MFSVKFVDKEIAKLEEVLLSLSKEDFATVRLKQIRDIYDRSQRQGGTPVGNYTGGGQLRISAAYRIDEFGYVKEYAPHVEFGHRTRSGSFVPGQYYLKKNVDAQREIYKEDLKEAIRRHDTKA